VPSNPRSLLIMSCSQCKRTEPSLLPAIERYNGPAFRVLRRFLKGQPSRSLDVRFVSAEYGLISADHPIPNYDQRMTPLRAQELHPHIVAELRYILSSRPYQELCICMGKDYYRALHGYDALISTKMVITIVTGSPGKRLADLQKWLYGKPSVRQQYPLVAAPNGKVRLRGSEITITAIQALDVARRALIEERGDPNNYQSWYVLVDGKRVAPKWLVSHLIGLPLSAFTTDDARRLLAKLGIEVRHV
jgi:uncharacterized protein DUF6884